ncbi:AI-2E family transporter [Leptothermofonsia sp. ETS-13]|uniref:AI-2E family transporter n=1 Tax=Leptothermofonsia sp. ETS-13 TaxID=3035696 RepID=UPI003B9E64DF
MIDQATAPRILSGFTELKPIWVIITLLLGTKLFGFPGLLLTVPVASFINSLLEDETLQTEPDSDNIETVLLMDKVLG